MAENKMKEVAELLGIEMDKPFNIKGYEFNPCVLTENRFINNRGQLLLHATLFMLLTGELEIEKQILNDSEKRYLENILRPFNNRVIYVKKTTQDGYEVIRYRVHLPTKKYGSMICELPYFDKGTMYEGMELDIQYSLEELGLFENDGDEDVD